MARGLVAVRQVVGAHRRTPNADSQIEVLLYRLPTSRLLVGILYHYRTRSYWEKPGNINLFVHDDYRRQGIGTTLIRHWQQDHIINWEQQRYSVAGARFIEALNKKGAI